MFPNFPKHYTNISNIILRSHNISERTFEIPRVQVPRDIFTDPPKSTDDGDTLNGTLGSNDSPIPTFIQENLLQEH